MVPSLFAAEKPLIQAIVKPASNDALKADADIIETAGILPTNPFYFLKEFSRGVRRALTVNPVSKVEYEFQVAKQKILELQALEDLNPENLDAIEIAIGNYGAGIARLRANLEAIKDAPSYANLDALLNKIAFEISNHQSFFESLGVAYSQMQTDFEGIRSAISSLASSKTKDPLRNEK